MTGALTKPQHSLLDLRLFVNNDPAFVQARLFEFDGRHAA